MSINVVSSVCVRPIEINTFMIKEKKKKKREEERERRKRRKREEKRRKERDVIIANFESKH
jgi:hypothetical protein